MSLIAKPTDAPLNPMGNMNVPAMELPSFRFLLSQERRTTKNILIQTPYALGDCVCAEPAIRYAIKAFKGCSISLMTPFPELYKHLMLKKIYGKDEKPVWDDYYILKCYYAAEELQGEFVHNFNMAIPDYIATCLFKGQIPVADRHIKLSPALHHPPNQTTLSPRREVVVHAGKHWVSKTFPKHWWDEVLACLIDEDVTPTLIGASLDDGKRGTVAVETEGCMDLRNKLSVMESTEILQCAQVVLTNDSAPLHIAASGHAWIGFLSTVRHPDYVTHWRPDNDGKNVWGYKMENLAKGQIWQDTDVSPLRNGAKYDLIDYQTLLSWLPTPLEVAEWAISKLDGRN